jgi:hypothetical protein
MIGFPLLCRFFVIFTTISIKTQVRLCNGLISFSYHPYFCIIFLLSCMIEQEFSEPISKHYVLCCKGDPLPPDGLYETRSRQKVRWIQHHDLTVGDLLSKMLGHTKASTTEDIYSHVIEESKQQASNMLAQVYFRNAAGQS